MKPETFEERKFDPARFQQTAGGVLAVITALTVLIGVVAVSPILQTQRAKTELERLKADLEISKISGRAHSVLEPAVQVTAIGGSDSDRYFVVTALLTNKGNRPISVHKAAFRGRLLSIVDITEDGELRRGPARPIDLLGPDDEHGVLKALVVEVGETQALTTVARIRRPGLYLVEVSASPDGAESLQFTGQQFFFVPDTNPQQEVRKP